MINVNLNAQEVEICHHFAFAGEHLKLERRAPQCKEDTSSDMSERLDGSKLYYIHDLQCK